MLLNGKVFLKLAGRKQSICTSGGEVEDGTTLIQEKPVNRVTSFKYIDASVQEWSRKKDWISWYKTTGVLRSRKVPDKVKRIFHKQMVRPAMLYSLETPALTRAQENKLEVSEMRMHRYETGV